MKTERTVALVAAVRPSDVPPSVARQHVVQFGYCQVAVAYHRKINGIPLGFLDILGPFGVVIHRVNAQADNFAVAFFEFRLQLRHVAQFGSANRREILGVGKQYGPAIAYPFMEINAALGGGGGEIGRFIIDS